jgi:hypothetical protein
VGRRQRRRAREGRAAAERGPGGAEGAAQGPSRSAQATTEYTDGDGNVLTLRDELSEGTLRMLRELDSKPAATAEDRWQRRVEFLFERLAARWEIAGLPLESQKELLGRYRMAGAEERGWIREVLAEHLRERYPEIEV